MTKQVRVNFHGVEGTGRTLTEAREDAGKTIKARMTGTYTPEIIAHKGYTLLLWRDLYGWNFSILTDHETGKLRSGFIYGCSGSQTFEDARNAGAAHLARCAWEYGDGSDAPDILTTKEGRQQFTDWALWQARYKTFRAQGCDDSTAHRKACGY